jgi:hypothetical protein
LIVVVSHRLPLSPLSYFKRCFQLMVSSLRLHAVVWSSCLGNCISLKMLPLSGPQRYLRPFCVPNVWKLRGSFIYIIENDCQSVILRYEARLRLCGCKRCLAAVSALVCRSTRALFVVVTADSSWSWGILFMFHE